MSTTITGIVTNGGVMPNSPLPEVEFRPSPEQVPSNPLLHFTHHLDPNDPLEQEFLDELARQRREDLEETLREDDQECPNSSSTPTT